MSIFLREIQTAYFRSVKFYVRSSSLSGGTRLKVWEYPNQNENYIEDLGLKSKTFEVDAFVIGDDYIKDKDVLIAELDEGYGKLDHPVYGSFYAYVEEYSVEEDFQGEARSAKISITFRTSGSQSFPDIGFNFIQKGLLTINRLTAKLNALNEKFFSTFAQKPTNLNGTLTTLKNLKNKYNSAVSEMTTPVNSLLSDISATASGLNLLLETPATLTRNLISIQNSLRDSARLVTGPTRRREQLNIQKRMVSDSKKIIASGSGDETVNRISKEILGGSLLANSLGNSTLLFLDYGISSFTEDKEFFIYLLEELSSTSDFFYSRQKFAEENFPDIFFESEFDSVEEEINNLKNYLNRFYRDQFSTVKTYTATGESLLLICFKIYGSLDRLEELLIYNDFTSQESIVGSVLCPQ